LPAFRGLGRAAPLDGENPVERVNGIKKFVYNRLDFEPVQAHFKDVPGKACAFNHFGNGYAFYGHTSFSVFLKKN
jgi:hypothetical protein